MTDDKAECLGAREELIARLQLAALDGEGLLAPNLIAVLDAAAAALFAAPVPERGASDIDGHDFYELMQAYRHAQPDAAAEFRAVRQYLRDGTLPWPSYKETPQMTQPDERATTRSDAVWNNTPNDTLVCELHNLARQLERELAAALSTSARTEEASGVVVPREPTNDMVFAGEMRYLEQQYPKARDFASNPATRAALREVYKAMLAAAPSAPVGAAPVTREQMREVNIAGSAYAQAIREAIGSIFSEYSAKLLTERAADIEAAMLEQIAAGMVK